MRRNQVINITLSEELLMAIDKQSETEIRNRSELIREALRMYLLEKSKSDINQSFTDEEIKRVNKVKYFFDANNQTILALSCSYRPQPNKIDDLFSGTQNPLIKYVENPESFRSMGWDMKTLGRAKPVAGEYLEITNGDRKVIRIYRDGQILFGASEDFFGWGMEQKDEAVFNLNGLAAAETIANFINFSIKVSEFLSSDPKGLLFKIRIFNAKRKVIKMALVRTGNGYFPESGGEFGLDLADRDVFIKKDTLKPEHLAYLVLAEFNYLFGLSEDRFWYVNKDTKEMNFNEFKS